MYIPDEIVPIEQIADYSRIHDLSMVAASLLKEARATDVRNAITIAVAMAFNVSDENELEVIHNNIDGDDVERFANIALGVLTSPLAHMISEHALAVTMSIVIASIQAKPKIDDDDDGYDDLRDLLSDLDI